MQNLEIFSVEWRDIFSRCSSFSKSETLGEEKNQFIQLFREEERLSAYLAANFYAIKDV